jgi:hypothetical protein
MSKNLKSDLSETLKRYNLLTEYKFYVPRMDEENYDQDDIFLDEQDVPMDDVPTEEVPTEDVPMEEPTTPEMGVTPEPTMDTTTPPMGGEVEVDVTDIVKDTKETKDAVNSGNQKVDELLNKLKDLETKLASMDSLTAKIDNLESEFEKRNPTPEEKLEMRSLDSFPYNLKLTDYWAGKEGAYNVLNNDNNNLTSMGKQPAEKEYVLTRDEIEKDYSEGDVSDSFYPED